MPALKTIRYLQHHQIDKPSWDQCIASASNGLIYAFSIYLDKMAFKWDALVLNDYEAVMPLPWRKKMGIYYLYQPFLTAQLGLFGKTPDQNLLAGFLSAIPEKFRLWEFSLNHGNLFQIDNYHLYARKNYVLDLSVPYLKINEKFRENIKRNLKKSLQSGCYVRKDIPVTEVISLTRWQAKETEEKDFENFSELFNLLCARGQAKTYGVFSKKDELLSSAAFLFSHNRAYYILVGNHPNGRTVGASHMLVDAFIRDHAEQQILLDFEGSDIRNLAFFYSSFGAKEEEYMAIKRNCLPWYIRLLKK